MGDHFMLEKFPTHLGSMQQQGQLRSDLPDQVQDKYTGDLTHELWTIKDPELPDIALLRSSGNQEQYNTALPDVQALNVPTNSQSDTNDLPSNDDEEVDNVAPHLDSSLPGFSSWWRHFELQRHK